MLTTYIRAMGRKQQLMFSMPFQAELRMCTFKADDVSSSSRQSYTTSTYSTFLVTTTRRFRNQPPAFAPLCHAARPRTYIITK